jgi:hypothetical protein
MIGTGAIVAEATSGLIATGREIRPVVVCEAEKIHASRIMKPDSLDKPRARNARIRR